MENKLKLRNISKFTLDGLNLDVREGEILTLLGSSGSGKTTLLRIIAGIERADRGSVEVDGKIVSDESHFELPENRNIGLVFQSYHLFPHLTVEKNIGFGLKNQGWSKKKKIIAEMVKHFELEGLENRYPHELSGGQQQRVALARTMATQPSLILFDEPFSHLDEHLRENVRQELKQMLTETNETAIFVTHDKKDALSISDRIALLHNGVIEQVDTPEAIYTCPASSYAANYFGRTNLIPAKVNEGGFATRVGFIQAEHHDSLGQEGMLSIRPHWCVQTNRDPLFTGKVEEIVEYGECQEVTLDLDCCMKFYIHLHRHERVRRGEKLGVAVDPPQLRLIPEMDSKYSSAT